MFQTTNQKMSEGFLKSNSSTLQRLLKLLNSPDCAVILPNGLWSHGGTPDGFTDRFRGSEQNGAPKDQCFWPRKWFPTSQNDFSTLGRLCERSSALLVLPFLEIHCPHTPCAVLPSALGGALRNIKKPHIVTIRARYSQYSSLPISPNISQLIGFRT